MKVALVGSRFFAASVLAALSAEVGIEFIGVVAPSEDDRLAIAGRAAGLPVHVLADPRNVPAEAIPDGCDLIIAAHTHARVSDAALAKSRLGGVGYHPSLLPRHRGIAAVEWTILEGDPIAGGSVYHLADGWDAGAIAAQDWCFVLKGENARQLWERALAPMGIALLAKVVHQCRVDGVLPAFPQDQRFATQAKMIRRSVVLTEDATPATVPLVVTVVGADRHGIVSMLAERAQRYGANWAASRMTRLSGEFSGTVHFDVPREHADALVASLNQLASAGLQVVIASRGSAQVPASLRCFELELVGEDRVGIVSRLTGMLAERGVSIESIHTDIIRNGVSGNQTFKIGARLLAPATLAVDALRTELGTLASDLMVDIALDERADTLTE